MNRDFLKMWQKRPLGSDLVELSATWDLERVLPLSRGPSLEPHVETHEERRAALVAIVKTLGSLYSRFPHCLTIIGLPALPHLDERTRRSLLSARNETLALYWNPGDNNFVAGGQEESIVAELSPDAVFAVGTFFLGIDPDCVLIFSHEKVSPEIVVEELSQQEDHSAALRASARPGALIVYPALDGDVVVFVTSDDDIVQFIQGNEAE
ncbi:MAG: hypothetical protein ACT4OI_06090 [Methanobacteriota archaeon]